MTEWTSSVVDDVEAQLNEQSSDSLPGLTSDDQRLVEQSLLSHQTPAERTSRCDAINDWNSLYADIPAPLQVGINTELWRNGSVVSALGIRTR